MRDHCRTSASATSRFGKGPRTMKWLSPCTRMPTIVRSSLEARGGNRMTDREMIQHLSLLVLNIDIAVHLLIIERAEKRSPVCCQNAEFFHEKKQRRIAILSY